MDSRTAQAIASLTQSVNKLMQVQAYTNSKLINITREVANLKLKYANLRSPAIFEINDFEKELRGVEVKLQTMQNEVSELTADLIDFTEKIGEAEKKKKK
jgi:chromosome segregation ATPase